MTKYYFIETFKSGEKTRVRALAGQSFNDGTAVDTSFNISCSSTTRDLYSIGTIFFTNSLKLSKSGKFYSASSIKKLSAENKEASEQFEKLTGKKVKEAGPKKLLETIISDSKLAAPTASGDGFYMSDGDWRLLIRNIKKHVNTMILGPTGCGKTSCVKEVCNRLGIPLHVFDMGSMIDPISSLLGVHRLEKGHSVFDYAKFTQVIQEPCVILLDELNRSSLGANNILFPCLDDRRKLSIEIAAGKGIRDIAVHPEVTFIATANIGAEYSGTNAMDRALMNRFFPLELGCIPDNEEEKVLIKRTGISSDTAKLIVKIANNIRSLSTKQEISMSLSIRETLMVSSLVSDGWDMGKAMEMIYLPLYEGTKGEGERSTVYKTLLSY